MMLEGKRVLITAAAGGGIGFATARRCAEEGAEVGENHHLLSGSRFGGASKVVFLRPVFARAAPQKPRETQKRARKQRKHDCKANYSV